MALTLAEIRAKLQAQDNKQSGNSKFSGDNTTYAHWNIEEGETASLRFLPDADAKNSFFWVERNLIRLPFAGIKGQADSKPVIVQVPCMEMWGESCPILAEVRPWFKDKSLEDMGRKYWKKRSYLMQGFVRENPIADDAANAPENPIRRFIVNPSLFNIIKASLMDPELENLPTDYDNGLDFRITKTSKGAFADYGTSKWARKESALTEAERNAIEQYGLFNLADFLPKKPTDVELKVMKEMFEASVDGQAYDMEAWGQYFKPMGAKFGSDEAAEAAGTGTERVTTRTPSPAPSVAAEDPPFDADPPKPAPAAEAPKASNGRAEDILAMIRNRQKA